MGVGPSSEAWNLIGERVRRAEPFFACARYREGRPSRATLGIAGYALPECCDACPSVMSSSTGSRLAARRALPSSLRRTRNT